MGNVLNFGIIFGLGVRCCVQGFQGFIRYLWKKVPMCHILVFGLAISGHGRWIGGVPCLIRKMVRFFVSCLWYRVKLFQ